MRLRHSVIAVSFSMSFAMFCRRRVSSSKSQAARVSTSFILREISRVLVFQPSDPEPEALLSVAAWVKAAQVTNVRAPIVLDASQPPWPIASADGIICINMIHISPWDATIGLIRGAASILPPGSSLYLYGPTNAKGSQRPLATKRSIGTFAVAIRPGVCEISRTSLQ